MNTEVLFRIAFWVLLGLMVLIRAWFAFRVRLAGERLMPDRTSIHREGWLFPFRFFFLLLLIALFVQLCFHPISPQRLVFFLPFWLRWIGFALGLASLGLWTWTYMALGRFWSAQLRLNAVHRLVTYGPYSRVRHPMYAAILGWVVGIVLVIANWIPLIFAVYAAVFVVARIPREEQMMLERFGDEYKKYMKQTGKFFPRWRMPRRIAKISHAA
jgi:protein-S-isoprenylcysteine O-methyltransferase Ste14